MPQYVGMPDEDPVEEADEFAEARTTKMVHSQGHQRDTARQQHLLRFLANSGTSGGTAREAVDYLKDNFDPGEYHGPVSGALTKMRDAGLIEMLTTRRSRFHIYVLPEHVAGRTTKQKEDKVFGRTKAIQVDEQEVARLKNDLEVVTREAEQVARRNAELTRTLSERDVQVDNLLEERTRNAEKFEALRADLEAAQEDGARKFDQIVSQGERLAENRVEIQRLKDSEQNLRERAEDAEAALVQAPPAAGPRKVMTEREKAVLAAVAKEIGKRSDGTRDNPARITLKVATVRTLGAALQRITSD